MSSKNKGLSLDAILRKSTTADAGIDNTGLSGFPFSVALAPPRSDYDDVKFSQVGNRTLMIGKDVVPPTDIFRTEYSSKIQEKLDNEGIIQLNSLQRAAYGNIVRGRNCTIIGGAHYKKGKSLSYLIPISSSLIVSNRVDIKSTEVGPVGLILCGSAQSCEKVCANLNKLIAGTKYETLVVSDFDKISKRKLKSSTDFVLTTVGCALHLFDEHFEKFQFQRLRYLVFDDTQISLNNHLDQVEDLISKISNYRSKLVKKGPIQTIFCGTEWNEKIASATVKVSNDTVLLIGSSLAAIQYGGVDVQVHYCKTPEDKLHELARICGSSDISCPTIIICNENSTMEGISVKLFRDCGIKVHFIYSNDGNSSFVEKLRQLKCTWSTISKTEKVIFVVTDEVLKDMHVSDATILIHYELPANKQEGFGERHKCMWDHFPDISHYNTIGEKALLSKVPLKSHVFISSQDPDFYKIILKLYSINVSIPEALYNCAVAQSILAINKVALCEGFKAFGKCINTEACKQRHHFNKKELTSEGTVPKLGRVQVEIIAVENVNSYTVKLLSYYEAVNKKKVNVINYINRTKHLHDSLQDYYSVEENCVVCENYEVGTYCAITDNDGLFRRGRVKLKLETESNDPRVRLYCLDFGEKLLKRASQLYVLPESLDVTTIKPLCVTLYLANLKPIGGEPCYQPKAQRDVTRFVGKIYTGKIVLSIGNSIWVSPLVEHKRGTDGEWLCICNVRLEITKTLGVAEDNPDHMELLYQNCEKMSGLNYDHYRAASIIGNDLDALFHPKCGKVEWAFLSIYPSSKNDNPLLAVWCSFYKTLSLIFVQRDDRCDGLDRLVSEMDRDIATLIEDKYGKYATIFEEYYEIGLPIAAFEVIDQKWNRGMIVKKSVLDGEVTFDVFFVDHGDIVEDLTMDKMFPLRKEYVTRLPFQTILLRCQHIAPIDANVENLQVPFIWEFDERIDELIEPYLIFDNESQQLDISAIRKEGNWTLHGVELCRMYSAFILSSKHEKELGELVVEAGLAKYIPNGNEEVESWKAGLLKFWNRTVERTVDNDESDDEIDDFDVYLGFEEGNSTEERIQSAKEILTQFGLAEEILDTSSVPAITESSENLTPKPEIKVIPKPALQATPKPDSKIIHGTYKSQSASRLQQPQVTPDQPVIGPHFKKPRVEWSQTPELIMIWILIPDLTQYTLDLHLDSPKHSISFRSHVPDGYGFDLNLIGKVVGPIEKLPTGQHLSLKLKKLSENFRWPYLIVGKPSYHWLKSRIDDRLTTNYKYTGYDSEDSDVELPGTKPVLGNSFRPDGETSSDEGEELDMTDDEVLSDADDNEGGGSLPPAPN